MQSASEEGVRLETIHEVPSYSFFVWGFTLPKRMYSNFISYFGLKDGRRICPIKLLIGKKEYDASVELVRVKSRNRGDVVRIMWRYFPKTQKALRKLFMYSYAATINKNRPTLKELMLLEHVGGDRFVLKAVGRQRTDFDRMFNFLEDRNLFEYWKDYQEGRESKRIFVDSQNKWTDVRELDQFRNRSNVIYMLYDSKFAHLYVGQAARLGSRVKEGQGRVGLSGKWNKFKFFELHPDYQFLMGELEAFLIRAMASLVENEVGIGALKDSNIRLVNKQLTGK